MRRKLIIFGSILLVGFLFFGWRYLGQPTPQTTQTLVLDIVGTPPPYRPQTSEINDNGQVRLFSGRGQVESISENKIHLKISQTTENEEGIFVNYLFRELLVGPNSQLLKAWPDSSAENGLRFEPTSLVNLQPGQEIEFYSPKDFSLTDSLPLTKLVVIF